MTDICDKYKLESTEPFSRVGFDMPITQSDIYELTDMNGAEFYQILFPILRDFTQRGLW